MSAENARRIEAHFKAGARTGGGSLRISSTSRSVSPESADRVTRAARWALAVDARLDRRLAAGEAAIVPVPGLPCGTTRVAESSVRSYRNLRLTVGELVRPWLLAAETLDPPLLEDLYPFQRQGVEWLCSRPCGAILADDMGLGKTVQVVTAIRLLFNRARLNWALVLCPKNLLANWEREFGRWAPELGIAVVTPSASIREQAWVTLAGRRHVLVTNYEQMRRLPNALQDKQPDLIVADEAHRLRRPAARITAGVGELKPRRFWALSGTPLERHPTDVATLLSLVEPTRFAPSDGGLHPSSLRAQARPYLLRRRKEDVLDHLPPVRDTTDWLPLNRAQELEYRTAVTTHRSVGGDGNELALLTRLRAICNVDSQGKHSSKLDRIEELLERIRDNGEKAVVFSTAITPLRTLRDRLQNRWGQSSSRLLIGDMGMTERHRAVAEFRQDARVLALLASVRVGGEGLTLVEANHVFLIDQWWNPSTNDQVRDRVVRIGQRNKVRVYRFCCRGTIEQHIEKILETKRRLFDATVDRLTTKRVLETVLHEVGIDRLLSRDASHR